MSVSVLSDSVKFEMKSPVVIAGTGSGVGVNVFLVGCIIASFSISYFRFIESVVYATESGG